MSSLFRGFVVAACVAACGAPAVPKTVSMRLTGGPRNASVTIDDRFVGTLEFVASRGVALPVGVHHVTVDAPGFLPWDQRVEATDGAAPIRFAVSLVPIPD